ncbi:MULTISPECIES: hypothetical protein [unclassified Methylophaga]|jgi:hypothetical protein|uniref:hypothetical protein n=1 Tax=unclassified Methylophaga TaxID=2629249 RepID=UPI00259D2FA6|nr:MULTISPECIES: hypothetical protein [unclassified Methylophaga]|tara:strand:+ start:41660 stop:41836 length:177 start_codon:yes stop_codon:yes gene_type:complete
MSDLFFVNAGKYEDLERNYKVSLHFNTFEEALKVYDECSDYPWVEMKYKNRIIEVRYE